MATDEKHLILSWSLLQAYYGLADSVALAVGEEEQTSEFDDAVDQPRELAAASVALLDTLGQAESLTQAQVSTVRNQLKLAASKPGDYEPPVRVWPLRDDGTRKRVFASLRLRAFNRLLRQTAGLPR